MDWTRRAMLAATAGAVPATPGAASAGRAPRTSMGMVIHSFAVRGRALAGGQRSSFADPFRFLDYCEGLGVGGVQVGLGACDDLDADRLRERAAAASMSIEGIAALPRDDADRDRFEAEIKTAKRAGATIVRTVMLSGRRYETFDSLAAFRTFADRAVHSLSLAAPIVVRHGVRLAVENHKDWRADELIAILKRLGCDHVGVCLDTGNSMALLEDPMEVIEARAPHAITTHFKDMGVEESADGFWLAEVPLGSGVLDLPRAVAILRGARPDIRINLEMITRDPLKVPCLADRYWATFPDLPGLHLARSLSLVRRRPASPLPRIASLDPAGQLAAEDENIRRCLAFGRDRLGL